MKVLLTGGAGFIGSNFVDLLLAEGHSVSIFDDFNDFYDPAIKRANIAGFAAEVPVYEADLRGLGCGGARGARDEARLHRPPRSAGGRPSIDQGAEAVH